MLVLGIETSCDETGVALFDTDRGLLAHAVHTQALMHGQYGGVVPELASRDHIRRLVPLIDEVLEKADRGRAAIDAIAVTTGPGLAGALLVGTSFAFALGFALQRPVIEVHHLEGHLLSPLLAPAPPPFPFVALLVSGGHTQLFEARGRGDYLLLGESLDDAAGEAFDKVGQLLGLGYPGGPAVSSLADAGVAGRWQLPRPLLHSGDLDFSFSGLKTAVSHAVATLRKSTTAAPGNDADIAAEFVAAVVDVLVAKALAALDRTGLVDLVVAGGVGANRQLRARLTAAVAARGATVTFPPPELCTDNGAMIALAGASHLLQQTGAAGPVPIATASGGARLAGRGFTVHPRWPLDVAMRSATTPADTAAARPD